jgi:hypothetical protein
VGHARSLRFCFPLHTATTPVLATLAGKFCSANTPRPFTTQEGARNVPRLPRIAPAQAKNNNVTYYSRRCHPRSSKISPRLRCMAMASLSLP